MENTISKDAVRDELLKYFNDEFWLGCWSGGDVFASVLFSELLKIAFNLRIELPEEIIKRFAPVKP